MRAGRKPEPFRKKGKNAQEEFTVDMGGFKADFGDVKKPTTKPSGSEEWGKINSGGFTGGNTSAKKAAT